MTTRTTCDKLALVDVEHHWKRIDPKNPPPSGAKLLLIDERLGVAVIGNYTKSGSWTHFAGFPTFKRGEQ